jgi:cytidylate kinase
MQRAGAFLREFHPNPILYHADMAQAPVVIEDGRTQEEALWAHERGMLVVVLDAPLQVRMERVMGRDGGLPDIRTLTDDTEQDFAKVRALRFDTVQVSIEQIVEEILEKIGMNKISKE